MGIVATNVDFLLQKQESLPLLEGRSEQLILNTATNDAAPTNQVPYNFRWQKC